MIYFCTQNERPDNETREIRTAQSLRRGQTTLDAPRCIKGYGLLYGGRWPLGTGFDRRRK